MIRNSATLKRGLTAAALSMAVGAGATSAQAETVLAEQDAATSVSAYAGRAVWSAWDPASRVYRLATSLHGSPASVLAVPARAVPFDVDVGPDRSGRPVAVYSRCNGDDPEDLGADPQTFLPNYAAGRDCDVRLYDFARGRERRVRGASERGVSEYIPTIWRDRIAFARIRPRRAGRSGRARLAVVRVDESSRSRLLPRVKHGFEGGPISVDLYGARLAFVWHLIGPDCDAFGPEGVKEEPVISELWLERLHGSRRRLAVGCTFDPIGFLHSPSFAAGRLSWVIAGPGVTYAPPRRFATLRLSTGETTETPAPSCLSSMVRATDAVYTARYLDCPTSDTGVGPSRFQVSRSAP